MNRLFFCPTFAVLVSLPLNCLLGPAGVQAAESRFPYQATVQGADVYARSGPGRNYYPTNRLQPGQQVTVHRHDPGGWYMIAPPAGSFSWIRADYVRKEADGRGVLTENNVIVRVGSEFGDDRDIEQVRLSTGAVVNLLGEKTFHTQFGDVRMYKIAPPRGEYRWVEGRFLVPVGGVARTLNDRNPYRVPSTVQRQPDNSHELGHPVTAGGPKLRSPASSGHSSHPSLPTKSYDENRRQLAQLDLQFRNMVEGDPATWRLNELEAAYRQLRQQAAHPLISRRISQRLATLAHYRSVKAEYDKMIQLTARIERRDAELAGRIPAGPTAFHPPRSVTVVPPTTAPTSPPTSAGPSSPAATPGPVLMAPQQTQQPGVTLPAPQAQASPTPSSGSARRSFLPPIPVPHQAGMIPAQTAPAGSVPSAGSASPATPQQVTSPPTPSPTPSAGTLVPPGSHPPASAGATPSNNAPRSSAPGTTPGNADIPRFDGAGIIRRIQSPRPGFPPYGLFAPNGRFLAYLQPVRGLPLERYLNQPMGVIGRRIHRPEWGADFITVRAMMPVRLLPQ